MAIILTAHAQIPVTETSCFMDGAVTPDTAKLQSCWSNHFITLFQSQIGSSSSLGDTNKALPHLQFLSKMNFDDIIDDNFTVEEIEVSIRKLKSNKAGGLSQVWWRTPHIMADPDL